MLAEDRPDKSSLGALKGPLGKRNTCRDKTRLQGTRRVAAEEKNAKKKSPREGRHLNGSDVKNWLR